MNEQSFKHGGATFTVRPLTGYDQYLMQAGWRGDVMLAVARHEGYDVTLATLHEAPAHIVNMALDFANLMLTTTITGKHDLTGVDLVTRFNSEVIAKAWVAYRAAIQSDGLREKWLGVYRAVNLEDDTDPKADTADKGGVSA